jgi:excisionase family DNA binding protein
MQPLHERLAWTIEEFTTATGICRATVYEEIAANRLRAVKRGRSTLILHRDAQTYLENLPPFESGQISISRTSKAA